MKSFLILLLAGVQSFAFAQQKDKTADNLFKRNQVQTACGILEGTLDTSGIRMFKGIPYAAPPVGNLRWKAPQPVKSWTGVRKASQFGPMPMQRRVFGDMRFRANGMSEDCLYLNVWTPAKSPAERLPVLVYFYGGGYIAGDGSEYRYDGESMARKGIVTLTVNYRLNVFGFFAHPELTKESPNHASGNYGLLDQAAALKWVQQNIAAFGGDPKRVTIAGESAGSISVSALMASPLSKKLINAAIGESGSILGALSPVPLNKVEETGVKFADSIGAHSLAQLRSMSAEQVLEATARPGAPSLNIPTVDGYFFPEAPLKIYQAGQQAHVPLLLGWNSEESGYRGILGDAEPTPDNYSQAIHTLYPDNAEKILQLYPGSSKEEVIQSATALASDRFIAYSTWKWTDMQIKTGGKPVYRYYYSHPRPAVNAGQNESQAYGAVHSAEIEYAMGNLNTNPVYAWTAEDYKVSNTMQNYFANFIKTGNPNGEGLPVWPAAGKGEQRMFMQIDVTSKAMPEQHRGRYVFLDQLLTK